MVHWVLRFRCRLCLEPSIQLPLSLPDVPQPPDRLLQLSHLPQELLHLGTPSAVRAAACPCPGSRVQALPAARGLHRSLPPRLLRLHGGIDRRRGCRCRPPGRRCSLCSQAGVGHVALRGVNHQVPRGSALTELTAVPRPARRAPGRWRSLGPALYGERGRTAGAPWLRPRLVSRSRASCGLLAPRSAPP